MRFETISEEIEPELGRFLASCGTSLESFRYFSSRPLAEVRKHLVSLLAFEEEVPVAYGHLDSEGDSVWLGICVAESHCGQGYGGLMMEELIRQARLLDISSIRLSVDRINVGAIHLYEKFGFQQESKSDNVLFYRKRLR